MQQGRVQLIVESIDCPKGQQFSTVKYMRTVEVMDNKLNAICIGECALLLQFPEHLSGHPVHIGDRHMTAFHCHRHCDYITQGVTRLV